MMDPDLASLVEQIAPFTSEFLVGDDVTIVDDDDLKEWDLFSDESLLDKYKNSSFHVLKASPVISGREEERQLAEEAERLRLEEEELKRKQEEERIRKEEEERIRL